jgi:hypothetical protein
MDRSEAINGFQLHDNSTFYQEIDAVSTLQLCLLVDNRNSLLAFNAQIPKS